jgi:hypothetical protein
VKLGFGGKNCVQTLESFNDIAVCCFEERRNIEVKEAIKK